MNAYMHICTYYVITDCVAALLFHYDKVQGIDEQQNKYRQKHGSGAEGRSHFAAQSSPVPSPLLPCSHRSGDMPCTSSVSIRSIGRTRFPSWNPDYAENDDLRTYLTMISMSHSTSTCWFAFSCWSPGQVVVF
jgi:hypothetical protein